MADVPETEVYNDANYFLVRGMILGAALAIAGGMIAIVVAIVMTI
jgi:hypothetical protein